jgi:hypothetical protein
LFEPDPRNWNRQRYCAKPACRKASKALSQKKWQEKPENLDYFKGPDHVKRVQDWRRRNPGYWKRPSSKEVALQDPLNLQPAENNIKNHESELLSNSALQDLLTVQPTVIIGLIANFIGSALQDDIAETLQRMQQSGQDILYRQPRTKGGKSDCKDPCFNRTREKGSRKLQLDRPSSGERRAY